MLKRLAFLLTLALAGAFGIVARPETALASGQSVSCSAYDSHGNGVGISGNFGYDGTRVWNVHGPDLATSPASGWSVSAAASGFTLGSYDYTGFYWANVTFKNNSTGHTSTLYPRINVAATGGYSYQSCS